MNRFNFAVSLCLALPTLYGCSGGGAHSGSGSVSTPTAIPTPSPAPTPSPEPILISTPTPYSGGINFSYVNGEVEFDNEGIRIGLDADMDMQISYGINGSTRTITQAKDAYAINLDGTTVSDFSITGASSAEINNEHGQGRRATIISTADGPASNAIQLTLTLELYDNYPNTVLTQATYENLGNNNLSINDVWSSALYLDRSLVISNSINSYDFDMVSMGNSWGNGLQSHKIFSVGSSTNVDNYNGGDTTNPEFDNPWGGGGTPLVSLWSPEMAMTIGVVEKETQVLEMPVDTQSDDSVKVGAKEVNNLGSLNGGGTFEAVSTSITVHSGDYYDGFSAYGSLMRDLGIKAEFTDVDYLAQWDSFGLDDRLGLSPGNPELVNDLLYVAKDLGIEMINIDSGWEAGNGYPNSDFYSESEFTNWLSELKNQGFKISLWWDPGYTTNSSDLCIVDSNGANVTDDWGRFELDPTRSDTIAYIEETTQKILGYGADRLFLDGVFMKPPNHDLSHPHDAEQDDFKIYKSVYDAAIAINPNVSIEYCPCGGSPTIWNFPYVTHFTTSDPDVMNWRPSETMGKMLKALAGADAPVNGDHIEGAGIDVDMEYMFPLILGLGQVYQTYFWKDSWGADNYNRGNRALYQKWFDLYNDLMLSKGEYLGGLYDLSNDSPGSHAIAKGDDIFYLFAPKHGERFSGDIEIRGLKPGVSYDITDYANNTSMASGVGPTITMSVNISRNDPLVVVATENTPTSTSILMIDNFESGDDNWVFEGASEVSFSGLPYEGSAHLNVGGQNGSATTSVDLSNKADARLRFWWKSVNFSDGDSAEVQVFDGTWHTVLTIDQSSNESESNNMFAWFDLSGFNMTENFEVRVLSNTGSDSSYLNIDKFVIDAEVVN